MEEKHIKATIQAPFFELVNPQSDTLIYVLHGYGQLAKYFIQKFEMLQNLGYTVIAPEGLHRFYLQGTSGRVGASWMTKENRELDIDNYITFLNSVHDILTERKEWKTVYVLGFSQGVATGFRWVASGKIKPSKFLMCSGMIPPDVKLDAENSVFKNISLSYFTGTNDPFKTEEAVTLFQKKVRESNLQIQTFEFVGVHEINIEAITNYLASSE